MKTPSSKGVLVKDKATFNYSNLIMQKGYVKLSFESIEQTEFNISSHSIIKILNQLNHATQISLEHTCITYITCAISNEEDTSEFEPSMELAPVYVTLLNSSKSFFCNANEEKPAIMITDFSLKKITSLLGNTIVGMSDYISIAIFIFSEDELNKRFKDLTKLSLRANILEKYTNNSSNTFPKRLFNGKANVPILLPFAEQNPRVDISELDLFLNNVEAIMKNQPQKNRIISSVRQSQSSKLVGMPLKFHMKTRSRQKFSASRNLMSPFASSSEHSRQNSNDFVFLENNNFDLMSFNDDDIQPSTNPGGSNKMRLRAKPKAKQKSNDETPIPPNEYCAVYDIGLERRLIPEKYIEMTLKALNDLMVKSDNVNLFDNKKKIARLNSHDLKRKNNILEEIWVEVRDINDNIVFVQRKALENKIKTHSVNDLIKIDDFEGKDVFIKNIKGLLGDNSNSMTKGGSFSNTNGNNRYGNDNNDTPTPTPKLDLNANSNQKNFFVVRLARIEIRDTSRYYTNIKK